MTVEPVGTVLLPTAEHATAALPGFDEPTIPPAHGPAGVDTGFNREPGGTLNSTTRDGKTD